MELLKIENESGSKYTFFVENHTVYVEAYAISGKKHLFSIPFGEDVVDGKLQTTSKTKLPITKDLDKVVEFLATAETRKTLKFESHEELMAAVMDDKLKTGSSWKNSDGEHCVYVYNK